MGSRDRGKGRGRAQGRHGDWAYSFWGEIQLCRGVLGTITEHDDK